MSTLSNFRMLTFTVFFIATFGTAVVCYGLAALLGGGDDKP